MARLCAAGEPKEKVSGASGNTQIHLPSASRDRAFGREDVANCDESRPISVRTDRWIFKRVAAH